MRTPCFVGIDTSNYTTSVALCDESGAVIANLKEPLPVKAGECGLRQSDAVFSHVRNLPVLMKRLRAYLGTYEVRAVGCSVRPRTVEGSYMPCFLAGRAAAESFAAASDVPVMEFSHQDGHVMAALYSSGACEQLLKGQFVAFHVSGGTTEALSVTPLEDGFSIELIGETKDLNAGQAIDRVGVAMGLQFPCGKEMEQLANGFSGKHPRPRICVREGNCHLSGLQNLAEGLYRDTQDRAMVSAYVLDFVGETLSAMTAAIDERTPDLPMLYAGGVMSNRRIQALLGARANTYFAEPQFSADNAAGIALLCRRRFLRNEKKN